MPPGGFPLQIRPFRNLNNFNIYVCLFVRANIRLESKRPIWKTIAVEILKVNLKLEIESDGTGAPCYIRRDLHTFVRRRI